MSERTWSPSQEAIFNWFLDGTGHLVVRARAGTGKTTTILEGVRRVPPGRTMLCAFNKRIQEELGMRLAAAHAPATVEAKTLHSLGFECVRRAWPQIDRRPDPDRGARLAERAWQQHMDVGRAPRPVVTAIAKLASLVKGMKPRASEADCLEVCLGMNVEVDGELAEDYPPELLADLARRAIGLAKEYDGTCDFDDMLWLPVEHRWMRPTYDLLVVDEAQDMNRTQLELALGLSATGGRICVVGDDRQAIYGFRGADSSAIDRLKEELHAAELPLTTTYRCPQHVVAIARGLVPDFLAAETAPLGTILHCDVTELVTRAAGGDFVLSRTNAPLTGVCMALLRAGKPARIQGRDVGKSLAALVRRMKEPRLPRLLSALSAHLVKERDKLAARTGNKKAAIAAKLEALTDQVETIEVLAEGLVTTAELLERILDLFADKGPADMIVCSSVHKAKGLEASTVYVLEWTLYLGGRRPDDIEEQNIHYVAVTRAMDTLVLVLKPLTPGDPQ